MCYSFETGSLYHFLIIHKEPGTSQRVWHDNSAGVAASFSGCRYRFWTFYGGWGTKFLEGSFWCWIKFPSYIPKEDTDIKDSTESASSVVLTGGMWTARTNEAYPTVTGHFTDQNWQMHLQSWTSPCDCAAHSRLYTTWRKTLPT